MVAYRMILTRLIECKIKNLRLYISNFKCVILHSDDLETFFVKMLFYESNKVAYNYF